MRACNKRFLSAATILVAFMVAGCTSPTFDTAPPMPSFETEEQLAAAHDCQAVYSCCMRSCTDARSAHNEPVATDKECMAACGTSLETCYEECK